MLEGDADALAGCNFRNWFPKLEQARQKILEWFVNRIIAFGMPLQLDYGAGKTGNGLHANMRSDLNGAQEYRAREVALRRGKRILFKRAQFRGVEGGPFWLSGHTLVGVAPS